MYFAQKWKQAFKTNLYIVGWICCSYGNISTEQFSLATTTKQKQKHTIQIKCLHHYNNTVFLCACNSGTNKWIQNHANKNKNTGKRAARYTSEKIDAEQSNENQKICEHISDYYQDGAGNFTKRNSDGKKYNSICNLQRPLTKIKWILYWNNGELTFYINECQGRKYRAKIDKKYLWYA